MKFWTKSVKALIAVWLLCAGLDPESAGAMTVDRVVAKVNNEIITLSGLLERYNAEISRYRQAGMTRKIPPKEQLMPQLLDKMIDEKLLIQDGKKIGISIKEDNILKALEDIKNANNLDDSQLKEMLEREATSMEQYKETIHNQILVSKVVGMQVKNRTKVADQEIRAYYRKNMKEFWSPSQVKARHILFIMEATLTPDQRAQKEATAQEVLRRLKIGETFEDLARKFSEDISAANGGDLGVLERGKMVAEFEKAVFQMKAGEISGLVRTPYGIHIIKVDSIQPGKSRPFDEVKEEIENRVAAKKFNEVYDGYMADLRKAAFIEKSLYEAPDPKSGKLKPLPDSLGGLLKNPPDSRQRPTPKTGRRPPARKPEPAEVHENAGTPAPPSASATAKPRVHPDSILPPLTIPVPQDSGVKQHEVANKIEHQAQEEDKTPDSFEAVQKALQHIKKLRDRKIISEAEYQNKKKELLKNLN